MSDKFDFYASIQRNLERLEELESSVYESNAFPLNLLNNMVDFCKMYGSWFKRENLPFLGGCFKQFLLIYGRVLRNVMESYGSNLEEGLKKETIRDIHITQDGSIPNNWDPSGFLETSRSRLMKIISRLELPPSGTFDQKRNGHYIKYSPGKRFGRR